MKIEVVQNYPQEIKDYVIEYNAGVDHKDINMVNTAINSIAQFLFSPNKIERQAAIHALDQIGHVQPGFLKATAKTLMIRYKGVVEEKKKYAAAALKALFIGKKAEKLIDDKEILETLKKEKMEEEERKAKREKAEQELVEKIRSQGLDLDFLNPFPEIKHIGQFFNNSLLNNQEDQAKQAISDLFNRMFEWAAGDRSKFLPACMLFEKIIGAPIKRDLIEPFIVELQKKYMGGSKDEKKIAEEILTMIYNSVVDYLRPEIANEIKIKIEKREKERLEQQQEIKRKAQLIKQLKVPVSLGWNSDVQEIAKEYNEIILEANVDKKKKEYNKLGKRLLKLLDSKDELIRKNSEELFALITGKNPEFSAPIVQELLKRKKDPRIDVLLQTIVEDIEKNEWADPEEIAELKKRRAERLQKEREEREKLKEQHEKIKTITIPIDNSWDKKIIEVVGKLNEAIVDSNKKKIQKIIQDDIKKLIYAKSENIRSNGYDVFIKILEKYPQYVHDILSKELVPLYLSGHEQRNLAVDLFGRIYEAGLSEKVFKDEFPDVYNTLPDEWAERKQEIENELLQKKIDAIKADVTQIRVKDVWDKKLQKLATQYNHGIKRKDRKDIMGAIQQIVEIHMRDKDEKRQQQATEIIGLIAKKNIELIQPTIQMFLQIIENSKDEAEKTRAIIGLGEVTRQRPGWAYFGIEKLIDLVRNDPDPSFRIKAMFELNKIAKSEPTMLIEHIDPILDALRKDEDKNVRRLAATTLGNMAEVLPIEAEKVLPALRDALHDEYILVRKFADKALSEMRKYMGSS